MANKLSFQIQVEGAGQSAAEVGKVSGAVDVLTAKVGTTGQRVKDFIAGFPPQIRQQVLSQLGVQAGQSTPAIGTGGNQAVNQRMAMLGLGAGIFSPWVGARLLSSSGIFNQSGGGGGGIMGTIFGQGGLGGFSAAFLALNIASRLLRASFDELREAVKRGSDLFLKSAGLATQPERLSQIQKTLAAVGFPAGVGERLLAMGQLSQGQKMTSQSLGNTLLGGSRGILSREELQAILNLSSQIAEMWTRTADAARQSANVSGQLFRTTLSLGEFKSEWNTFWEQQAARLSLLARPFIDLGAAVLKVQNMWDEVIIRILQKLHIMDRTVIDPKRFGLAAGGGARPESAWERFGLIINGGIGQQDYARQTAANTKRIADAIVRGNMPTDVVPYGMPGTSVFHLP